MKTIFLSIALITLTGCATTKYSHPYRHTQADYDRDFRECQMKYQAATPAMMIIAANNAFSCMELEKGWVKEAAK